MYKDTSYFFLQMKTHKILTIYGIWTILNLLDQKMLIFVG